MTKLAVPLAALVGVTAGLAAFQSPAQAQNRSVEVIVYGDDPCPRSADDEVVVCYRLPAEERYRIPERLRNAGPRQTREAWANRARSLETVTATGIQSCSPVGPGGHTGCLEQLIDRSQEVLREEGAAAVPPPPPPP